MERIDKIFLKENKKFIVRRSKLNDYYLLSEMFRKELLSDVLEYESILTRKIIEAFNFSKINRIEFISNKKYFESNKGNKLISSILMSENIKQETKMSVIFSSLTFGKKIRIIRNLKYDILFNVFKDYYIGCNNYLPHLKINKKILILYLFPIFEYMKNIRNTLSHEMFNLNIFINLKKAYVCSKKKYKMNKIILMIDNQLYLIHNEKFINRLWIKVKKNKKVSNKIFKEVIKNNNITI